ncbi:MAG: dephospho-CoA kinase [Armatimonadota bacterium]
MRIAITGGIASGKSTLLQMLRERGISTLSADALAGDVLWENDVQAQLMAHFKTIEPVSPVVLKSLLSQSDENRRAVNRILHPAIAEEMERSSAVVVEVPLLFETCLHVTFQSIWVTTCTKQTQIDRLRARYGNAANLEQISWQLDSKVAISFADSVIPTDGDHAETLATLLQEAKRWGVSLAVS